MDAMPARRTAPAQPDAPADRKPFPPRRHKVAAAEDQVTRRNAPGETTVALAQEVNRQLEERALTKTDFATKVGWNKSRVNKLLRPEGPTQAMTVDDLHAIARALGCDPTVFWIASGISAAQVDLLDAAHSDRQIGRADRRMIVRIIELARTSGEDAGDGTEAG